jgi:hypothetical protein
MQDMSEHARGDDSTFGRMSYARIVLKSRLLFINAATLLV